MSSPLPAIATDLVVCFAVEGIYFADPGQRREAVLRCAGRNPALLTKSTVGRNLLQFLRQLSRSDCYALFSSCFQKCSELVSILRIRGYHLRVGRFLAFLERVSGDGVDGLLKLMQAAQVLTACNGTAASVPSGFPEIENDDCAVLVRFVKCLSAALVDKAPRVLARRIVLFLVSRGHPVELLMGSSPLATDKWLALHMVGTGFCCCTVSPHFKTDEDVIRAAVVAHGSFAFHLVPAEYWRNVAKRSLLLDWSAAYLRADRYAVLQSELVVEHLEHIFCDFDAIRPWVALVGLEPVARKLLTISGCFPRMLVWAAGHFGWKGSLRLCEDDPEVRAAYAADWQIGEAVKACMRPPHLGLDVPDPERIDSLFPRSCWRPPQGDVETRALFQRAVRWRGRELLLGGEDLREAKRRRTEVSEVASPNFHKYLQGTSRDVLAQACRALSGSRGPSTKTGLISGLLVAGAGPEGVVREVSRLEAAAVARRAERALVGAPKIEDFQQSSSSSSV